MTVTAQTATGSDAALSVRIFESAEVPADRSALAVLEAGVAGADLAAPAAVLPDFHLKADKEMPSSIAVATRDVIQSTFTCCSLNCGMALAVLDIDPPSAAMISEFYGRVRDALPYPPSYDRVLTRQEVMGCAADGAEFAVAKYGLDPAVLAGIEEGGRLPVDEFGGRDRVRRELPWLTKEMSRIRFGTIGPSNHFIELQQVESVFDAEAARLLGIEAGQITLQYHGGGGTLPGQLGVLFGARKRYTRPLRMQMAIQKPLYHLARARSLAQLRTRAGLYFAGGALPIERDSVEGERLMLATVMAMNYGFAFRLATFATLDAQARRSLGATGARLVVDSPHNTIYEEQIGGRRAIVHRHNAARAYPASRMAHHPVFGQIGQPVLLPGTSRTSSYLCVAGAGAERSLYSASHGAGTTVDEFARSGRSAGDPRRRSTLRFRYAQREPVAVPQLDDRGVDAALRILQDDNVLRPVARMRPLAVLN
ncbi:MAG TPA: RtcB family protein [Gaiellales bacterium]|jgi:tRNA-splicing ligase RtcB|nr:RtcB family protein [Gaiellales bacterium]